MPFVNLCLCLRVLSNFDTYTTQKSNSRTVVFAMLLFTCLGEGGVSSIAQRAEGNWHVHKHEYIHISRYVRTYTHMFECVCGRSKYVYVRINVFCVCVCVYACAFTKLHVIAPYM